MNAQLFRDASSLRPGDHACWVYDSDESHRATLIPYIREGLARGERVLYFHFRQDPAAILDALREAGEPVDDLVARGALVMQEATAAYLAGGSFDAAAMVAGFAAGAAAAVEDGFTGLRAAGETEWLVPEHLEAETAAAYEFACAAAFGGAPLTGLCGYDARYCDPLVLQSVEAVHPVRIRDDEQSAPFWVLPAPDGVRVGGEVDFFWASSFERALSAACSERPDDSFDVSALRFVDAAALRSIVRAVTAARSRGGGCMLRDVPPIVRRCLELVGAGDLGGAVA